MSNQKNILEDKVFTRFLVFSLLIGSFFLILTALEPNPSKSAYVKESDYIRPYARTVAERKKNNNTGDIVSQTEKVAKKVKKSQVNTAETVSVSGSETSVSGVASLDSMEILEKAIGQVDSGNYQAARDMLEAALEKDPNNEQLLVELGMIYLIDYRQPENALPLLERALTQNPSNKVVLSELVGVYQETSNIGEGQVFIKSLLEKNPENADLNLGMGQILLAENNMFEAVGFLEKAIEQGNTPDYVYNDLAEVYSKIGKPEKAIETYQAAVEKAQSVLDNTEDQNFRDLNEDMLDRSLLNLARELTKNGQYKEAESTINSILKRRPQQQEALYQLGKIYQRKG